VNLSDFKAVLPAGSATATRQDACTNCRENGGQSRSSLHFVGAASKLFLLLTIKGRTLGC